MYEVGAVKYNELLEIISATTPPESEPFHLVHNGCAVALGGVTLIASDTYPAPSAVVMATLLISTSTYVILYVKSVFNLNVDG